MPERTMSTRTTRGSRFGLGRLWSYGEKTETYAERQPNKVGAEEFWPVSMDKENHKAARILRSFCTAGVLEEVGMQSQYGLAQRHTVSKRIPTNVMKNAKGVAIFTSMRAGLWYSGAGGCGILLARLADGNWSPPSGIILHTAAVGFSPGVDIYDCVLVLNTKAAVESFSKWRLTLGGDLTAAAGPMTVDGDNEIQTRPDSAQMFIYSRSRGFVADMEFAGTVVVERTEENEKYYGHKYSGAEILSGKVRNPPSAVQPIWQTLKLAQGDTDIVQSAIPTEPPPSDLTIVKSDAVFGVPDQEDPDPFGVLALEKEGFLIKEAGSKVAASPEMFDFRPSPSSPIFDTFNGRTLSMSRRDSRRSSGHSRHDSRRSSWRNSAVTVNSIDRRYVTMDTATQTDFPEPTSPDLSEFARAIGMDRNNGPSTPQGFPSSSPRTVRRSSPRTSSLYKSSTIGESEGYMEGYDNPLRIRHSPNTTPPISQVIQMSNGSAPSSRKGSLPVTMEEREDDLPQQDKVNEVSTSDDVHPGKVESGDNDDDDDVDDDDDGDDDDDEEEPVIVEHVQQAARPQIIFKPRVVSIGKYIRPDVPSRNPSRMRHESLVSPTEVEAATTDPASSESARSSSLSQESRQRTDSVTSTSSSQPRSSSFQSAKSAEDKDEPESAAKVQTAPNEAEQAQAGAEETIKQATPVQADDPPPRSDKRLSAGIASRVQSLVERADKIPSNIDEPPPRSAKRLSHDIPRSIEINHAKIIEPPPRSAKRFSQTGLSHVEEQIAKMNGVANIDIPVRSSSVGAGSVDVKPIASIEKPEIVSTTGPTATSPAPQPPLPPSRKKENIITGPRISLKTMKLSLDDDDDDEQDEDEDDVLANPRLKPAVAASPRKGRLDSLEYNYYRG